MTSDSGLLWFFQPSNLEIFLKVLNACTDPYHRYWVFVSGLTNVEVSLSVEDMVSGQVRAYSNPSGTAFQSVLDRSAFFDLP